MLDFDFNEAKMIARRKGEWKTIASIILAIVIIEAVMSLLLRPYLLGEELESDLKQMQKEGLVPNLVAIGDSTVITEIDPLRLEQQLDDKSAVAINGGMNGSFLTNEKYYLKDLIYRYPINTVILGIDYTQLEEEESPRLFSHVLDRIKTPTVWCEAAAELLAKWNDGKYLLQSYRYHDKVNRISENVSDKLLSVKEKRSRQTSVRGFEPLKRDDIQGGSEGFELDFDVEPLKQEYRAAILEAIQLCRDNEIEIYLFAMPYASSVLWSEADKIQKLHDQLQSIADEANLPLYDLNFIKNRQELTKNAELWDAEHVLANATPEITDEVANIINESRQNRNTDKLFYDSALEARDGLTGIIEMHVDVSIKNRKAEMQSSTVVVNNKPVEYAFYEKWKDKEILLQDYSKKSICKLALPLRHKDSKVLVKARTKSGATMWRSVDW